MVVSAIDAVVTVISSIGADVAAVGTAVGSAVGAGATAVGLGAIAPEVAGIVGTGITTGIEGGLVGGALSGIEGKNVLKGAEQGAEFGAVSGGVLGSGLGGAIGSATGLGPAVGADLAAAAGGALGGVATGTSPLTGALEAGGAQIIAGGLKPGLTPKSSAGGVGGGVSSAVATSAPSSVPLATDPITTGQITTGAPDVTSGLDTSLPSSLDSGATSAATPGTVDAGAAAGGQQTAGLSPTPASAPISTTAPDVTAGLNTSVPNPTVSSPGGTGGKGVGGILSGIEKNPLQAAEVGALGASLLKGNQKPPFYDQLQTEANQLSSQGKQMQNYLESGTLPPGLQQSLTTASQNAEASIKSYYAQHGMTGSSAEAQDLANLGTRVEQQGAQIALSLFQQGQSESQLAEGIYGQLMNVAVQQDQQFGNALTGLTTALARMGTPLAATAG